MKLSAGAHSTECSPIFRKQQQTEITEPQNIFSQTTNQKPKGANNKMYLSNKSENQYHQDCHCLSPSFVFLAQL
jgi:hypothetical protein